MIDCPTQREHPSRSTWPGLHGRAWLRGRPLLQTSVATFGRRNFEGAEGGGSSIAVQRQKQGTMKIAQESSEQCKKTAVRIERQTGLHCFTRATLSRGVKNRNTAVCFLLVFLATVYVPQRKRRRDGQGGQRRHASAPPRPKKTNTGQMINEEVTTTTTQAVVCCT